jgi:voltage-gated potassium channel
LAIDKWSSPLVVASQALALVPGLGAFGVFRAARAARLVRVLIVLVRIVAIGGATAREGRTYLRRHAAGLAVGVAALSWLTSAAAFMLAEGTQEDDELYSFGDALWWATMTITTVGYGDVVPVTAAGRLVAGFTMVVGISTFAVVTAKVAEFLVRDEAPTSPNRDEVTDVGMY